MKRHIHQSRKSLSSLTNLVFLKRLLYFLQVGQKTNVSANLERKHKKLTKHNQTDTHWYILLLVLLENLCIYVQEVNWGQWKICQKLDPAIILPGLKIFVKKTKKTACPLYKMRTGLQQGQMFAENGRQIRREHWKCITKLHSDLQTQITCAHWTGKKPKQKKIPQITSAQEKEEGGNRDKSMKRIHKDRENNTVIRKAIN